MTVTYRPSPNDQAREQVARYEATDGREGGSLDRRPVVILTTIAARTGSVRNTPVMRIMQGDNYIAVASNGGATVDRAWPGFARFRAQAGDRQIPLMVLEHTPATSKI